MKKIIDRILDYRFPLVLGILILSGVLVYLLYFAVKYPERFLNNHRCVILSIKE